jgi:hypothetical protein
MSDIVAPDECKVSRAAAHSICRCGGPLELGSVIVNIGGMQVRAGIEAEGVRWPNGVGLTPDVAARIEPMVRREWLQAVGALWDTKPADGRKPQ